ncbi:H+transporting two-sector ATPase B/B' subunit [Parvibaculum lavamentivorans DS-1]|uniref:ATP synthase subunit b 1 n=1 Tax=Parvibaculum lavamentivorans (strain DS-1 / DSM 13023 / NCIMB 13966) TaxID=402881 RepID=ATPF1_PARL1|nr:ATP synthase subunit b 1 [Parvibaculum lavamentivorans]A7HQY4.1 RecName: Full=ATP synthase subunit b 1; AltName: Full=ATP synthase F(0) sector subunit b 1; AltName: Full=ATPase subunit I 1; AltName: Full=F-type ATPase subunit b 1; Short=F-ATPase subunit b 1 [Parvibaculum lavamentivorans DS-1]ABS62317.1 H+transporting two-sector ATPase B/B' subunit [Parvibaculum lavamentivorans DS-1]
MFATAEFWILACLVAFFAILGYFKVHRTLAATLDKRAADIAAELDEARRLREEAQQLLASYQRKQREAMKEAEDIVAQAKVEAEQLAKETRANMEIQVERRTKLAEDKIAQAETQALNDVRATAAEVAVGAARRVIAAKVDAGKDAEFVEKSISELTSKLH